jgi:uncharacterized SAM-binding protein YcdF (DUF218 family)
MTTAVVSVLVGLLIAILVIGTPYWLTHRHMRPQHDADEAIAYQQATARSADDIAAGKPGRPFRQGGRAARQWQAAHAGVDPETGEADPKTGRPGWPDGTG